MKRSRWILLRLAVEGARIARSQPVTSVVTLVMAAAVCLAVLVTTGESATTQRQVIAGLDSAGVRLIIISDETGGAEISPSSVSAIASTSGVAQVVGVGPAFDLQLPQYGDSGPPIPARYVYGDWRAQASTQGHPGQRAAVIGVTAQRELGLTEPVGSLVDVNRRAYSVTAGLHARGYLSFLNDGVLLQDPNREHQGSDAVQSSGSPAATLSQIYVLATSASVVDTLVARLPALVSSQGTQFTVTAPTQLLQARAAIAGSLTNGSRNLMLLVLGGGLVLEAATMYGAVSGRRRDFGRRRALGASRSTIVLLVLVQTAIPAVIGVVLGAAVGLALAHAKEHAFAPTGFVIGITVLDLLASLLAATIPALTAAFRDPVRILRVP